MILDGSKTVDIKLSSRRIAPYQKITPQDQIFLKESSGPVVGRVTVAKVEYFVFTDPYEMLEVLMRIQEAVGIRDEAHVQRMWQQKNHLRYGTVFWMEKSIRFEPPVPIIKFDRNSWISNWGVPVEIEKAQGYSRVGISTVS